MKLNLCLSDKVIIDFLVKFLPWFWWFSSNPPLRPEVAVIADHLPKFYALNRPIAFLIIPSQPLAECNPLVHNRIRLIPNVYIPWVKHLMIVSVGILISFTGFLWSNQQWTKKDLIETWNYFLSVLSEVLCPPRAIRILFTAGLSKRKDPKILVAQVQNLLYISCKWDLRLLVNHGFYRSGRRYPAHCAVEGKRSATALHHFKTNAKQQFCLKVVQNTTFLHYCRPAV